MTPLTRKEAMERLRVGKTKLWEMVRDRKITAIRRDGCVYFDAGEIDAYWDRLRAEQSPAVGPYETYRKRRNKAV